MYTVAVQKVGTGAGTVTSSVGAIDCGAVCSTEVASKTKLTLTATPTEGSVFSHWSGGTCSGAGPCTRTIDSSRTVKAVFTAVGSRVLTVEKAGTGSGTVTGAAAGIDCGTSCMGAGIHPHTVRLRPAR